MQGEVYKLIHPVQQQKYRKAGMFIILFYQQIGQKGINLQES